ncbi:MAG: B12-binding domain-containing radical SAM protein [Promethearchaeota archaeon]
MNIKNILLLEPFKRFPGSGDELDIAMLEHLGKVLVTNGGIIPTGLYGPPLGLAQLSAVLKQRGYGTAHEPFMLKAYSVDLKDGYIERKISAHDFDAVGMSIGDPMSGIEGKRFARIIKQVSPDVPVIVGGMQPSFFPGDFLSCENIDFVIRGKGSRAFPDLLDSLNEGRHLHDIPGACVQGKIRDDFAVKIPLDQLPPMDLDGVEAPRYLRRNKFVNVQTSRGCPFNCPFCLHAKFWGLKPEYRPVETVKIEMEYFNAHGAKMAYLVDSAFTLDGRHVERVKRMLKEIDNQILIGFETRADSVNVEMLNGMADVGLRLMWFGAESGSPRVLKNLRGKHHGNGMAHLDNLRRGCKMGKDADLVVGTSWIVGLPGETPETIKETVSFMKELIHLGVDIVDPRALALFPGTDYYCNPKEFGLSLEAPQEQCQQFRTGTIGCGTESMRGAEIAWALSTVKREILAEFAMLEMGEHRKAIVTES